MHSSPHMSLGSSLSLLAQASSATNSGITRDVGTRFLHAPRRAITPWVQGRQSKGRCYKHHKQCVLPSSERCQTCHVARAEGQWDSMCHLCGKRADDSHIASKAHVEAVNLSATSSWLAGGLPLYLCKPHTGSPAYGQITQSLAQAWRGPHLDSMGHHAQQILNKIEYVTRCSQPTNI